MTTAVPRFVATLDTLAQATAWALRRFTPVTGAGVCWDFWRCGTGLHREPGALTVGIGRLELVMDLKGRR